MTLQKLANLELTGKKVLLRLDLNVPMNQKAISDSSRIDAALPTLQHILKQTNKIVVMSHLGRPKSPSDTKYSLEPVGVALAERLGKDVVFVKDYTKEPVEQVLNQIDKNQFILLENLRYHVGELENEDKFSKMLAKGMDYYVNDAFGALHRAHGSIVGAALCFAQERRAMGFLVQKEIEALDKLRLHPEHPYTVVIGGAKVSDKIGTILSLLKNCNNLLVGGAMAYTFLKFLGKAVGNSQVEHDKLDLVSSIYRNAEARKVSIRLPVDHICAREFAQGSQPILQDGEAIAPDLMGLDIGPRTAQEYRNVILGSKTVFWNGPMGVFEWDAFAKGTLAVADAVAKNSGYTVVGGGDSLAALNAAKVYNRISHVSTGGGASLEYLEGLHLPGLKVLMEQR